MSVVRESLPKNAFDRRQQVFNREQLQKNILKNKNIGSKLHTTCTGTFLLSFLIENQVILRWATEELLPQLLNLHPRIDPAKRRA